MKHLRQVNERCGASQTLRWVWRREAERDAATSLGSDSECIILFKIAHAIASNSVVTTLIERCNPQQTGLMSFCFTLPCLRIQLYCSWCTVKLPIQASPCSWKLLLKHFSSPINGSPLLWQKKKKNKQHRRRKKILTLFLKN